MNKLGMILILTLVMVCFSVVVVEARIIMVDGNGLADYTKIQDAIDGSKSGDEIIVRPGVYRERINFYGKAITIRSVEPDNIFSSYSTVIDAESLGITVTFDSGEGENSKLIGLVIQGGTDSGIYCYYASPVISKCIVRNSVTGIRGSTSSPAIVDCVIMDNTTYGMSGCNGQIVQCLIKNNNYGIHESESLINSCDIGYNYMYGIFGNCAYKVRNSTIHNNGSMGIWVMNSIDIMNCVISGNGDIGIYIPGSLQIKNSTIVGNKKAGICHYSSLQNSGNIIENTIIVANKEYGIKFASNPGSKLTLSYNNIWGNTIGNYSGFPAGQTDTHENPLFAVDGYWQDSTTWIDGDYHLKSVAGRWTKTGWVNDNVTSPCIDAGNPIGGYLNETEPNGLRINQGAYGGTEQASKSPWGPVPYCAKYPATDVNLDCRVDLRDFAVMLAEWLNCNLVPVSACQR